MLRQAVFSSLITSSEGFSNDFNEEIFPKPHFCVFQLPGRPYLHMFSWTFFFFLKIFFFFFGCEPFFKVFIEFVTILFLFYVLALWSRGLWDLSSLTRDQTCTPCVGRLNLNHQGSSLLWTLNSVGFWKGTDSLLPSHASSSSSLCHYFCYWHLLSQSQIWEASLSHFVHHLAHSVRCQNVSSSLLLFCFPPSHSFTRYLYV